MTEAEFQGQVVEVAHLLGWRVAHFRPAMTMHGWRTAVSADGAGFPDLFLVRGDRTMAIECKSAVGHLTPAQGDWMIALERAGVETHVWRSTKPLEECAETLR